MGDFVWIASTTKQTSQNRSGTSNNNHDIVPERIGATIKSIGNELIV
jgi:hypothetical protein